jgi:hypothetical protein
MMGPAATESRLTFGIAGIQTTCLAIAVCMVKNKPYWQDTCQGLLVGLLPKL